MLAFAGDRAAHSLAQTRRALAQRLGLNAEDLAEWLPSRRQRRYDNRVSWAKVYLEMAGLLATPSRGHLQITPAGAAVLADPPPRIDIAFLERFESFRAARDTRRTRTATGATDSAPPDAATPEEQIEQAAATLREQTLAELKQRVAGCSPEFFETLVVDLLVAMGYGGNRADAGRAIGGSGDAGVDGVIHEDRLGLDTVYIQAKRWAGTVGRPEIQRFVGALHGQRSRKGVFITTGSFSTRSPRGRAAHPVCAGCACRAKPARIRWQ